MTRLQGLRSWIQIPERGLGIQTLAEAPREVTGRFCCLQSPNKSI